MDNLDINPTDPFGKYIAPNGRIGAVRSAQWYQNAYHTCIKDPKTDFPVPICFACDEAKLGGGTTGCWPLMFSTTIFNQRLHIINLLHGDLLDTYMIYPLMRLPLCIHPKPHICAISVYMPFLRLFWRVYWRHNNPMHWMEDAITLTLGGITKVVNIMVPINFIIGDMQGGDKICACSPCYSNKMQHLGHKYNVKGSHADDPYVKCCCMIMSCIQSLVVNNEFDRLDQINQYHVHNAWFDVSYGGCKYGIFSTACPVEALVTCNGKWAGQAMSSSTVYQLLK
jgi:hypothetical protein